MLFAITAIASLVGLAASLPTLKKLRKDIEIDPFFAEWSVGVVGLFGALLGIAAFNLPGILIGVTAATGMWLSPQLCDRMKGKEE